jgi:hypothetical protein
MPTYMDMHDIPGVKAAEVVGARGADLRVQGKYGVDYTHDRVDETEGKVFFLVDAPDEENATCVHREVQGLETHTLFEVKGRGVSRRKRVSSCSADPSGSTRRL